LLDVITNMLLKSSVFIRSINAFVNVFVE